MQFADPDYREVLTLRARIRALRREIQARSDSPEELLAVTNHLMTAARDLERVSERLRGRAADSDPAW